MTVDTQQQQESEAAPDKARGSLLKSSGITGSMTMVSRVLGLVRDIVIARVFGTTDATDAFFLANKIPKFHAASFCGRRI
jgi:putative peptidoglycan lipid II flippase